MDCVAFVCYILHACCFASQDFNVSLLTILLGDPMSREVAKATVRDYKSPPQSQCTLLGAERLYILYSFITYEFFIS